MSKLELPDDFEPTLRKDYMENGVRVEVWVQNKGLQTSPEEGGSSYLLWNFAIWVKGRISEAGPFRWSTKERALTDEAVCNNLFTFYKYTDHFKNAAELPELNLVPKLKQQSEDEMFVLRAISLVWSIFYSNKVAFPMEELYIASYSSLLGNKCALVGSKTNPGITYEVVYSEAKKKTYVTSYVETDKYEFSDDELDKD